MRQFYYTLMTLLRGRSSNIIKIISLTLGLFVGIILFARVAFELSYNTGYKDSDKLCVVLSTYTLEGLNREPTPIIMWPVPGAIADHFPDEVEFATISQNLHSCAFYIGEQRYIGNTVLGDTLFFRTLGIPVTSGSEMDLAIPEMAFVSEEYARRVFGTTEVSGMTLMYNKTHEITLRGTFKEVPDNNSVRPDIVLSAPTHEKYDLGYRGWGGGDSFLGYIRLRNTSDMEKINERIDAVIEQYMPYNPEKDGWGVRISLENIRKAHTDNPNVQRLVMILSFLAVAILLIAALNYVLIAISSLSRRARGIGVHKCNGATSGQIFRMFLNETGLLILISVILAALLVVNLNGFIEEIIEVRLRALFTIDTLWVPILIIVFIFFAAGVIPGHIFSRIPVTKVFRTYTERNATWKKILLFIQFGGISFVFGLLVVVYIQYDRMMNYDLGYNPERIAIARVMADNMDLIKTTIKNQPMVEDVALSMDGIATGYSGEAVYGEDGRRLFSSRFNIITPEFTTLYGFEIIEGRNVMAPGEVLVNEEYVRRMPWTDGALGKQSSYQHSPGVVVGVMKDFVSNSLFQEKQPVLFINSTQWIATISVRLREPFEESLLNLNREASVLFTTSDVIFSSLEKINADKYISIRRFRDSAIIAFVAILLIILMGLIGYLNDEIQRRSKEIAIRKVNGAEAWKILELLCRDISIIALPAVLAGIIISYFIGGEWLGQFAGTRIEPGIPIYAVLSLVMLLVILLTVALKAWGIANENPVKSIKSE